MKKIIKYDGDDFWYNEEESILCCLGSDENIIDSIAISNDIYQKHPKSWIKKFHDIIEEDLLITMKEFETELN